VSRVDADLTAEQVEAMLDEVRAYLPAYLSSPARVHRQSLEDVRELLRLEMADIRRLVAIHVCLSSQVTGFAEALADGMRNAPASSARRAAATRSVRGSIDWGGTVRQRAMTGNDRTLFAIRTAERDFDTNKNRVVAWLVSEIGRALRTAAGSWSRDPPGTPGLLKGDLTAMTAKIAQARKTIQLESIETRSPNADAVRAMRTSRRAFHREHVAPAAELMLRADDPGPKVITEILCEMLFEPDTAWRLYELLIALRLARAFDNPELGLAPAPMRLLRGAANPGGYATYRRPDGGTVELTYQGWPKDSAESARAQAAALHGLKTKASIPDVLMIHRDADREIVDVVVLELKASLKGGYLAQGLSQLLGYVGEHPRLLAQRPAAWLVAPDEAFTAADAEAGSPLWIVGASEIGQRATARMTA
jgi:hypothetical protein